MTARTILSFKVDIFSQKKRENFFKHNLHISPISIVGDSVDDVHGGPRH